MPGIFSVIIGLPLVLAAGVMRLCLVVPEHGVVEPAEIVSNVSCGTNQFGRRPVLVSIGGLPAVGKTTVARAVAGQLRAAYVRIDSIEAAITRAANQSLEAMSWASPPGYEVGYNVAVDQLQVGLDVVAESVNPLQASRDAWRNAAFRVDAHVIEVEIVCSDVDEHRRRAEERVCDLPGLDKQTWEQITSRYYDLWERDRVVVDTGVLSIAESTRVIQHAAESGT